MDHGKKLDERIWKDIVMEVDINGDGEISYAEFEKMMEKLLLRWNKYQCYILGLMKIGIRA